MSTATRARLESTTRFGLHSLGPRAVKGKGMMETFLLEPGVAETTPATATADLGTRVLPPIRTRSAKSGNESAPMLSPSILSPDGALVPASGAAPGIGEFEREAGMRVPSLMDLPKAAVVARDAMDPFLFLGLRRKSLGPHPFSTPIGIPSADVAQLPVDDDDLSEIDSLIQQFEEDAALEVGPTSVNPPLAARGAGAAVVPISRSGGADDSMATRRTAGTLFPRYPSARSLRARSNLAAVTGTKKQAVAKAGLRGSPSALLTVAVRAGRPAVRAGLPAVRAGQPAVRAGQPAVRAGQPAMRAGQPAVRADRPAVRAASRNAPIHVHSSSSSGSNSPLHVRAAPGPLPVGASVSARAMLWIGVCSTHCRTRVGATDCQWSLERLYQRRRQDHWRGMMKMSFAFYAVVICAYGIFRAVAAATGRGERVQVCAVATHVALTVIRVPCSFAHAFHVQVLFVRYAGMLPLAVIFHVLSRLSTVQNVSPSVFHCAV